MSYIYKSMLNELTVGEFLSLMERDYSEDMTKHVHTEYIVENHEIKIVC